MKQSNPNEAYKKRVRKIRNHLKKHHLKTSAAVEASGKDRITVSHILNCRRFPHYTHEVLTRIENHFSIK